MDEHDRATLFEVLQTLPEGPFDPHDTIKPPPQSSSGGGFDAVAALKALERGVPTLGEVLGEGGMGLVRTGEQRTVGREVAVKTLREGVVAPAAILHLLREAWVLGRVEHPNIVPLYDVGLDADGRPYLLLKRIEGEQWRTLMRDQRRVQDLFGTDDLLGWNLRVLVQLCHAVHYAHSQGLVHRDLKPSNVMIGAFGEVYLLDWGLAVSLVDDGSGRMPLSTRQDRVAGTPTYMAPEMALLLPVTEQTDVYLLGGLLYSILTGDAPHKGDTAQQMLQAAIDGDVEVPEDGPRELVELAMEALSFAPTDRPESAEAMRLRVEAYLAHRASVGLSDRASQVLESMERSIDAGADRDELRDLFGRAHFGFRQALAEWSGNVPAQHGLLRVVERMVRYELDRGDPGAARHLLVGVEGVDRELVSAVDDAERRAERVRTEAAALQRRFDPSVGRRTRWFIMSVLGVTWTVMPLLLPLVRGQWGVPAWQVGFTSATVGLGTIAAFAFWARESMRATQLNTMLIVVGSVTMLTQMMMSLVGWRYALPDAALLAQHFLLWSFAGGVLVATVERRLWPTAVAYVSLYVVAVFVPDNVHIWMGLANGILTVNCAVIWFPGVARILERRS